MAFADHRQPRHGEHRQPHGQGNAELAARHRLNRGVAQVSVKSVVVEGKAAVTHVGLHPEPEAPEGLLELLRSETAASGAWLQAVTKY